MKIVELIKANYGTYKNPANGTSERHWIRLLLLFFAAVFLSVFSSDTSAAYPIMVTGITILTGFTFTALFSNHVLADVGLPKPADESDRMDISRLERLSTNFKARSSYFILLSIIDAVLLIAASLKFGVPSLLSKTFAKLTTWAGYTVGPKFFDALTVVSDVLAEAFFVFVTFIFLECLYTFYRLSETIIAIVDTRRDYMKAANDRA